MTPLDALFATPLEDFHAKRPIKHLRRPRNELFTFLLDQRDVPFKNNLAERAIGPAVIWCKNSYSNRNMQVAEVRAILISIFTLKKQGHNSLNTLYERLGRTASNVTTPVAAKPCSSLPTATFHPKSAASSSFPQLSSSNHNFNPQHKL